MLLMPLLKFLKKFVIIRCPPPYLLLNIQLYAGIVFANVPTNKNCRLGMISQLIVSTSVIPAKRAQAIALHHHRRSLLTKLQSGTNDRIWWNLTKNISGLCKSDLPLMLTVLLLIL